MKILWVKAGKLLPVDAGGKIRSFHILRQLQKHHDVVVLTPYGGKRDTWYENEIARVFPGAIPIWTAAPDSNQLARLLHYIYCLPSRAPFAIRKFTDQAARRKIRELLEKRHFDIAVCDFLAPSLTFPADLCERTVLFQHNVETILWERMLATEQNWVKKLVYRLESGKMRRYEHSIIAKFRHIIAVSEQDRAYMSQFVPSERISVVPTGVDLEQYRVTGGGESPEPLVVFTGTMDFVPNVDGVEYFCREIWPNVLQAVPNARFRIVGKKPVAAVRGLASGKIEVTGTVDSIVEHLRQAWVVVVPLRIGGGTRLKIYEAMAAGCPVVSTSIGAEGLDVHDGKDIMLSDKSEEFAASVVTLLRKPELRKRYGDAAAQLAARFDWSSVAEQFTDILMDGTRCGSNRSLYADVINR